MTHDTKDSNKETLEMIPGLKSKAELDLRQRISSLNRLKDYRYTPSNMVMVTIDDMVELVYDLMPYTMQKLDEARELEDRLHDTPQR